MPIDPTTQPHINRNNAEVDTAQDTLIKLQEKMFEQTRIDNEADFLTAEMWINGKLTHHGR